MIINVKFCNRIDKVIKIRTIPNTLTKTGYGQTEWMYAFADIKKYCPLHNDTFFIYESLPSETKYNLKVTKGLKYGYLGYLENSNDISQTGTELFNLNHDHGALYFVYQSYGEPPVQEDTVVINVSTTDPNIQPVDVKYLIQSPKIQVTFVPNSIASGDTASVVLKKKNNDGSFSDFSTDQLFDLKLTGGAGNGMIFIPEGGYTTDQARRVKQGFSFIANELITESTVSSTLVVNTSEDEQIWGTGTVAIGEEMKLKINLTGSSEVWPYRTSGSPTTNAKIKVTNGDKPLANGKVKITIKRIDRSGGHDHPNSSDLTLWGRISVNGVKGNPVTVYTDQNGEITTEEIRASEFGGEYFIEAYLESKPGIKDKVDLHVRVPGLQLLPASSYYDKIGGTDKHHGPPSNPNDDHNHWGTNEFNNRIESMSLAWLNLFSNEPKLQINDMSLPYGGLFDINGQWNSASGHDTHREGTNADIKSWNMIGEKWKEKGKVNGWYDEGEEIINDDGDGIFEPYQLGEFRMIASNKKGIKFYRVILEYPGIQSKEHWHLIK